MLVEKVLIEALQCFLGCIVHQRAEECWRRARTVVEIWAGSASNQDRLEKL